MSARADLGKIIWEISHADERSISVTGANIVADAVLAAGYTKPRTITTPEELEALPHGSVVMDVNGDVARKLAYGWHVLVTESAFDAWLYGPAEGVDLPATVLYEPTA